MSICQVFTTLLTLMPMAASFINLPTLSRINQGLKDINFRLARNSPKLGATNNEGNGILLPKVIVFDLDGCLWRPEMYELLYFSGGRGAPFRADPSVEGQLLTRGDEPVYLLGNVRDIMRELWINKQWDGVSFGISSRTDEPDWARELLEKFEVEKGEERGEKATTLRDVFEGGPIEIAKDSKVNHFRRISERTGEKLEDMLFFDNESGNCREVARLGVTVAYCPDGVVNEIWNLALEAFPQAEGDVVGLDIYGYDTLDGANRLY